MPRENLRISQLLPALGFSIFAALFGLAGYMHPPQSGEMAVVFPPWENPNAAISKIVGSGTKFVSPAKLPNVFVVQIENEVTKRALYDGGALWLLAAKGLCGPQTAQID